jgi:hypothetical protein
MNNLPSSGDSSLSTSLRFSHVSMPGSAISVRLDGPRSMFNGSRPACGWTPIAGKVACRPCLRKLRSTAALPGRRGRKTNSGVQLFNRTTRKLHTTDYGPEFYKCYTRILAELEMRKRPCAAVAVLPQGDNTAPGPFSSSIPPQSLAQAKAGRSSPNYPRVGSSARPSAMMVKSL